MIQVYTHLCVANLQTSNLIPSFKYATLATIKKLHELSNHSPLLNSNMLPFISSVSCLFESVHSPVVDKEHHQKRLMDVVESWGCQIIPVEGDGNCCFSAFLKVFTVSAKQLK